MDSCSARDHNYIHGKIIKMVYWSTRSNFLARTTGHVPIFGFYTLVGGEPGGIPRNTGTACKYFRNGG